jgi:hypothetical protein
MYFQYGYFKPLVVQKVGRILTLRQLAPAAFVGSLLVSLISSIMFKGFLAVPIFIGSFYLIANLFFSSQIALKQGVKCLPVLAGVFPILHVSYGLGYLKGIIDFLLLKRHRKRKIVDLPLTR